MLGLAGSGQTTANLLRERECVLNLPSSALVDAVDRIALTTGKPIVSDYKIKQGYRYEPRTFAAGLTEQASDLVAPPRVAECPIASPSNLNAVFQMPFTVAARRRRSLCWAP